MRILVSNDDGISSKGIYSLAKSLQSLGEVYVVAPENNQSAISHAITMHQPLRAKKIKFFDTDIDAWWVSGTPADCVKLGIETLVKVRPDIVVSGINKGENLGTDVLYSGTVSAAIEGCVFGIPSIAFSYEDFYEEDFTVAGQVALKVTKYAIDKGIPKRTVLNVNIPKCASLEEIKDIKVTKLGIKVYKNNFEERTDPRGNSYYWLTGDLEDLGIQSDTDIDAVKNKYVSLTPINIDMTHYGLLDSVKEWNMKLHE